MRAHSVGPLERMDSRNRVAAEMIGPQHYGLLKRLSPREMEVAYELGVLCQSTKLTAFHLGMGYRTAETHRTVIYRKLGIHNVAELARMMALEESHET